MNIYAKLPTLVFVMIAATIGTLTDLGFLWFREFYLESSRVIQVNHANITLFISFDYPWSIPYSKIRNPVNFLMGPPVYCV